MKNLLIFILLVGCGVIYVHDKRQGEALGQAETDKAALSEQVDAMRSQLARLGAAPAYSALSRQPAYTPQAQASPGVKLAPAQDPDSLDRPAYK